MSETFPVDVVGVRVEMPSNQPLVLLRERFGDRYLPIWIGAVEATSIALTQQGITPPRPLTHDLIRDILHELDVSFDKVVITDMDEGVFYAELHLDGHVISARPSDAIAVALRMGVEIYASAEVLDKAGVNIPDEEEEEVEAFREFLDTVNPEDFGGGEKNS